MINFYNQPTLTTAQMLAELSAIKAPAQKPFSAPLLNTLSQLSQACLETPLRHNYPQLTALGFWLRAANIKRKKQSFESSIAARNEKRKSYIATSRGFAFHLPPANVDTLFIYSWALSFLSANANVVRLPTELNDVGRWLLSTLTDILDKNGFADSNKFVNFPTSSSLLKDISALSDLRLIWGGDAKVASVSAHSIRLDGLTLGFPNRQSFAVIGVDYYRSLEAGKRDALCSQFYNDAFWFDQMGCGSPRAVVWYSGTDTVPAKDAMGDFYDRLMKVIKAKGYSVETATFMTKFGNANFAAAQDIDIDATFYANELTVLAQNKVTDNLLEDACGGGYFTNIICENLNNISSLFSRKLQTVTHFGLEQSEVETLATLSNEPGGYRFVPIGQALNFDDTWDGIDLLSHMTRQTTLAF